ncbi:MAG: hypothetical protein F4X17_04540 [Gemmatimonadetes bacterium]|nr:hypothetical protein [Gemmatimonadota bacterium]
MRAAIQDLLIISQPYPNESDFSPVCGNPSLLDGRSRSVHALNLDDSPADASQFIGIVEHLLMWTHGASLIAYLTVRG